jgi:hypothetical protein
MPKPKRTKVAHDSDKLRDDMEVAVMLYERVDVVRLRSVRELVLGAEVSAAVCDLLEAFETSGTGWKLTKYTRQKDYQGRVYAANSLQTIKKCILRLIAGDIYTELDIVNCAPTCILHIASLYFSDAQWPLINRYVDNRDLMFEEANHLYGGIEPVPSHVWKKVFLVCLHGGSYSHTLISAGFVWTGSIPILDAWVAEIQQFAVRLRGNLSLLSSLGLTDRAARANDGSLTGLAWQTIESRIALHLVSALQTHGLTVGVLKFDGILVERGKIDITSDLLRLLENSVYKETGVSITLAEKCLRPTDDDWEIFYGKKHLYLIQHVQDQVIHLLTSIAWERGHKRREGYVWQKHATIPSVWEMHASYADYINNCICDSNLSIGCGHMAKLLEWIDTTDHPRFTIMRDHDFGAHIPSVQPYLLG